jgi:hypothetical protein
MVLIFTTLITSVNRYLTIATGCNFVCRESSLRQPFLQNAQYENFRHYFMLQEDGTTEFFHRIEDIKVQAIQPKHCFTI